MKIESKPAEHTIIVRDLDVSVLGEITQQLTVQPEDTLTISDDGRIEITLTKTGERIVFLAPAVKWYSIRERTVTIRDGILGDYKDAAKQPEVAVSQ